MDKLFALLAFLASLVGCDGARDTIVHRVVSDGTDLLFSRASVQDGVTRLDCVRSASGRCHYLVLPRDCTSISACDGDARRFVVPQGDTRQVTGLTAFRLCVESDDRVAPPTQCAVTSAVQ